MKKRLLLVPLLVAVPLLTACGSSNELKCERENDGAKRTIIIDFDSSKENATGITIQYTVDFSNVEDFSEWGCEDLEDCIKMVESEVEDCEKDGSFEACKVSNKTKTSVTVQGDMTKKSVEEELGGKTYDDTKKMFEDGGYTCK